MIAAGKHKGHATWPRFRSPSGSNGNDNVVVARVDILPGTPLEGEGLAVTQRIPAGHKVATRPIALGEPIRKFDQIIGFATQDIGAGEHIHVHNCGMREFARDYAVGQDVRPIAMVPEAERRSFGGLSCAATARSARATISASCRR